MTIRFDAEGNMISYKHEAETYKHIDLVCAGLAAIVEDLHKRGEVHDQSKFDEEEGPYLDQLVELVEKEGPAPFGTPEYETRKAIIAPMLNHHYAVNDHHPEHFMNGVMDMNLCQIVEMLCDWNAAAQQRDGAPMGLTFCIQRYSIDPQLAQILKNTCDKFGFAWK